MPICRYKSAAGRAVALASVCGIGGPVAIAGDLTPPAGPVRATMKPLDAIEPRVCINDLPGSQTATHVITEPGNYYLCADVTGEVGKHGILIDYSAFPGGASGSQMVSIELGGFSLVGVAGSLDAIHAAGTTDDNQMARLGNHPNVVSFIGFWGGDGIHLSSIEDSLVSGVNVIDCGGDGMEATTSGDPKSIRAKCFTSQFDCDLAGITMTLPAAGRNTVEFRDVNVGGNGLDGIDISLVDSVGGPAPDGGSTTMEMRRVNASANMGDGVRINVDRRHSMDMSARELMASNNGGNGVHLEGDRSASRDMSIDMEDLYASGNGLSGFSLSGIFARLVRCVTRSNVGNGATVTDTELELTEHSSGNNGRHGHSQIGGALIVRGGTFRANGTGPVGGAGMLVDGAAPVIVNSFVSGNQGNGVHVTNHGGAMYMEDVSLMENTSDGVLVENTFGLATGRFYAKRVIASENGANGFTLLSTTGGDIRECSAGGNGETGFSVTGTGHVFVWNSATDNGVAGYSVSATDNLIGPSTVESDMSTLSNPGANFLK